MKNSAASKWILFLLWSAVLVQPLISQMNRSAAEYYPNPYTLMEESSIEPDKGIIWQVLCNRENAPISKYPGRDSVGKAQYLELFSVYEKNQNYLRVKSLHRENIEGWMDMKHLILLQRCIKYPDTSVSPKVFIKVTANIRGGNKLESGLNSLRFRKGPGEGGKEYNFLTAPEEIISKGGLFFYLYGVHFNDESIDYRDTDRFKNADYFLIGDRPSFSISDNKPDEGVIRGWIPRQAAVLWDTRQALEVVSGRPLEGHKFASRSLLNSYFDIKDAKGRQKFLADHADEIIKDTGEPPPVYGQELRYIVLGIERKMRNVTSEYIGFIGQKKGNMGSQQSFLADLKEASFCDAYVALKEGNKRITRPVLLLSLYELQDIRHAIEEILTLYRYCVDSKTHQLLVKAMSTIIGEVLQVNPDQVTREDLQQWFKLSVAPETNFLGVQDIMARMCSNRDNWTHFLERLESAKKFIENLERSRPERRLYHDLQATPYFWVYPEEIFPPLESGSE